MRIVFALFLLTAHGSRLTAQVTQPLDSAMLAALKWRSIGPANMSGRVSDIEGLPSPSRTFYVATAAGGLWKTTNAGTTFDQVFGMNQPVISMGDVAIAPSDSNTLYLGTGEEDSRNSISPGAGMFKSTDAGKTWSSSVSRRPKRSGASSSTRPIPTPSGLRHSAPSGAAIPSAASTRPPMAARPGDWSSS
jgi:hypothetical protein